VVAWCAPGIVTVSGPDGNEEIPTATAQTALQAMGLSPVEGSSPACNAAVPIGASSGEGALAVVAAFEVAPDDEPPPIADVALFSDNGGATWTPIPVPTGTRPDLFGGFQVVGDGLEALFAPTDSADMSSLVEVSSDGSDWRSAALSCPTIGPCVTFGAYAFPGTSCAMSPGRQALLRSTDGGRNWMQIDWPTASFAGCAPMALVATSPSDELLVDGSSPYALTRSTDGGKTWVDVGIPLLRGQQLGVSPSAGTGGITMLPNGALLASGLRSSGAYTWELLEPGATSWCAVSQVAASTQQSAESATVVLIGTQLWWLSSAPGSGAAQHQEVSDLSC
jgi:hypothetical protein